MGLSEGEDLVDVAERSADVVKIPGMAEVALEGRATEIHGAPSSVAERRHLGVDVPPESTAFTTSEPPDPPGISLATDAGRVSDTETASLTRSAYTAAAHVDGPQALGTPLTHTVKLNEAVVTGAVAVTTVWTCG